MQQELWNIFTDTGDPMCYLLLRASEQEQKQQKNQKDEKRAQQSPWTLSS